MKTTNNKFFTAILLFVSFCLLYLFKPFLLTITIGILMAVSTASLEKKILKLTGDRKTLSAIFITVILCVFFLIPIIYTAISLAKHASEVNMEHIAATIDGLKHYDFNLPSSISFLEPKIKTLISGIDIKALIGKSLDYLGVIGKSSANFIIDMGFIVVFYFFANLYGSSLIKFIKDILPIEKDDLDLIFSELSNTMSVVIYSTILNVVLQGSLFAIIASIYGHDALLLGILFAFASLIPVVGGALIYVPITIYEIYQGNIVDGIVILVYSIVVISTIADNFIKPVIIAFINKKMVEKPANINEILIFFSMLAGMSTFGFWGIILGPAIVTFFLSVLKLYAMIKEDKILF